MCRLPARVSHWALVSWYSTSPCAEPSMASDPSYGKARTNVRPEPAFIDAYAGPPVTVIEIAAAPGLTTRAPQVS